MTTHSHTRAWKIPWTEELGRLQPMGSQRFWHDWTTELNWTTKANINSNCKVFKDISTHGILLYESLFKTAWTILQFWVGISTGTWLSDLEKNIALEKLEEQMANVTQFIFLFLIVIYFSTEREYILWVMGWTTVEESQGQSDLKLKNPFWRTVLFSTILHSKSAALNMPANLENSAVATGLEKVSFHSNPKERQCQSMFKLLHNCTHLTC